jgi:hypothetical protein
MCELDGVLCSSNILLEIAELSKNHSCTRSVSSISQCSTLNGVSTVPTIQQHFQRFQRFRVKLHEAVSNLQCRHVLCETAFTTCAAQAEELVKIAQAEELVKIAREEGLFLMEAVWTQYFPDSRMLSDNWTA